MGNKKIKNAKNDVLDGIKFKSRIEKNVYQKLKDYGVTASYEKTTFPLQYSFKPTKPLITKNKFKKLSKNVIPVKDLCVYDNRLVKPITYTPDFVFDYNGKTIVIEVKGFANDTFPIKFKLFRYLLETDELYKECNIEIWLIYTVKQLEECLNHLKQSL